MRPPVLRLHADELIVDSFAGGGGASTGIEWALGRSPDIAINHDPEAIAMHQANHPKTRHYCESVWAVNPVEACGGRKVGLAWFSPDCKHFSKAKGGKPVDKKIRGLADVVIHWAQLVRPRVIILENVEEFQTWGPLLEDGSPDPAQRGLDFRRWWRELEVLGYRLEMRELRACDYGAPTSRKRLFIIARCDGQPIIWPEATHGTGRLPYRTAADCIDFSIPCPSIFGRERPLAEKTLARIARGIRRYVIDAAEPFIVHLTHSDHRVNSVHEPLRTVTGAHRGEQALVTPYVSTYYGGDRGDSRGGRVDAPLATQTTANRHALVSPTLVQQSWGEREGQAPRCLDIHAPLGTIVAGGIKHALVSAFLAKHYGGHETPGSSLARPIDTITTVDHNALVTAELDPVHAEWLENQPDAIVAHITKFKGTCPDGQPLTEPLDTVQAGGMHYAEVRAFLIKYYGAEQDPRLDAPLHTVTTKHRFGLVTVHGIDYVIVDIGMRMLTPRELYRAQGFAADYVIDPIVRGKPLTKTAQVRCCGNAVPPPFSEALASANFAESAAAAATA